MKNGVAKNFEPIHVVYGGNVKKVVRLQVLGALVVLGAGLWMAACKSAPELTQAQAQTLIQAKYDQTPAAPFNIAVDDRGMQLGVRANYWLGTKRYPNGYWADFQLTDTGKKVVKLPGGGDVIQWRPESPTDSRYVIVVVPLVSSRQKTRSLGEVQSLGDSRTVTYFEDVDLSGLPDGLQNIAHDPMNKLSTQRVATFVLTNGAWTLQSIE